MNNHPAENEAVGAVAIQAGAGAPATSQLITLDPAKYVAEVFKPFNDKLAVLKLEADTITPDASTTAGMDVCIKYRAAFRDDVRIAGEKARADRKAPILQIGKLLDTLSDVQETQLNKVFEAITANILSQQQVFMHRDYHPRNLMHVNDGSLPNPGILDFQDAVFGPITYDIASLLRDAYIQWDEELVLDWVIRYWQRAKQLEIGRAHV